MRLAKTNKMNNLKNPLQGHRRLEAHVESTTFAENEGIIDAVLY